MRIVLRTSKNLCYLFLMSECVEVLCDVKELVVLLLFGEGTNIW